MKKNRNNLKEHRKIKKIKVSALTVWIAIEILALLVVASVIIIHRMYDPVPEKAGDYSLPGEEMPGMSVEDIELPTDLIGEGGTADTKAEEASKQESAAAEEEEKEETEEETPADDTALLLSGMDTAQKVDALLVTTPESLCNGITVTVAGDIFKEAYTKDRVSGLLFRDANFRTEEAGAQMLLAIHDLSNELNGMDILIGYRGNITDPAKLSARGINLMCISPDAENAAALVESAVKNNMIPAYLVPLADVAGTEPAAGFYIAQTEDVKGVTDAINAGRTFLYMTENHKAVRDGLIAAVNDGTISAEALDKAAGFALTIRRSQTTTPQDTDNSRQDG